MLTSRGRPEDVLRGFESGADDYLPKPFELAILIARIRSLLRRGVWHNAVRSAANGRRRSSDQFTFAGRTVDFDALELRASGKVYPLTVMEASLLRHLIRHEGRVATRKNILEEVWNLREDTDTRAIDGFVVRLRRYIEDDPSHPRHLITVRTLGYRFIAEPDKANAIQRSERP
jgi:DNA-binding response OmpR family regulator